MASLRILVRLASYNKRFLTTETVKILTLVRHNSTTSLFTRNPKWLASFNNSKQSKRSLHDDKAEVESNDKGSKETNDETNQQSNKQLTQVQRLRKVFADYGSIGFAFHMTISLTSLGICYTAVSSGLDVPSMLQKIGLSQGISDSTLTTGASTFVIAYACHKVFAPLRMFMTITCTPLIVRRLRSIGILRTPPKKTS